MRPQYLTVYRNSGWQLPIQIVNKQIPQSLTGYRAVLLIAPAAALNTLAAGSFGTPVITNMTPVVTEPGTLLFQLTYLDTGLLEVGVLYNYAVMLQAPGENPAVIEQGFIRAEDSPIFPTNAPALA